MLDPFQAAWRKIVRRTQARLRLKYLVGNVADLERGTRLVILPTADREHLAADFPDMQSAPLDRIGGGRERFCTDRVVTPIRARSSAVGLRMLPA